MSYWQLVGKVGTAVAAQIQSTVFDSCFSLSLFLRLEAHSGFQTEDMQKERAQFTPHLEFDWQAIWSDQS